MPADNRQRAGQAYRGHPAVALLLGAIGALLVFLAARAEGSTKLGLLLFSLASVWLLMLLAWRLSRANAANASQRLLSSSQAGEIAGLRAKLSRSQAELARVRQALTERQQYALFDYDRQRVLHAIAQNRPLDEILQALIAIIAREEPGVRYAEMHLSSGNVIQNLSGQDADRSTIGRLAAHALRSLGQVTTDEPVITSDFARDLLWARHRDYALSLGLKECWLVPVRHHNGEQLATIVLFWSEEVTTPWQQLGRLLEMAATLAAIAIEQHTLIDELAHRAHHDALTKLPNRELFYDRLERAIAHAQRHGHVVGVLFLDLDRFKAVNDTLGHHVGDGVLREVARRMQEHVRQEDTVARMGGDEFTAILPGLASTRDAEVVARRLIEVFTTPFHVLGETLRVTGSVGLSVYPRDGEDIETLLKRADSAMYRIKAGGRNGLAVYAETADPAR